MTSDIENIEVEYKFAVEDKDKFIALLDKIATFKKNKEYQKSTMFDNTTQLMQAINGRIRVRTLGDVGQKTLTYKRPLESEKGAKREVENEVSFFDPSDQIEKILNAMDFRTTTSYERYTTEWIIKKSKVTLDEYPFGAFLEIEGEKDEIAIVSEELGFDINNGITKPIDTLFLEWRQRRGLPYKAQMRFEDFDR